MNARKAPQRLVNEVQLFRIRVAAAESKLKELWEQAREAKRRRKEAKRIAQAARKRFKRSKTELSELREALAKAEAKLFQAGGRALARRKARAKRIAKTSRRVRQVARARKPGRPTKPSPVRVKRRSVAGQMTKTKNRPKIPPRKIARRQAPLIPNVAPVQLHGPDSGPTLDSTSPAVAPEDQAIDSPQGIATGEPA
jgi:hypothetical protein